MTQSQRSRPQLASARVPATLEAVRAPGGEFDIDAYHVMQRRDDQLIEQEILHGAGSAKFVYTLPGVKDADGKNVSGVSVVGARHLAAHYGGLHHRLVASTQKTGGLFLFTSYPAPGMPMVVTCSVIPELEDEPDFYLAICEVEDIKTGNKIQVERRELRYEQRRDGSMYEKLHYATIAQSKAYRNAVLDLLPQDVLLRWKLQMLKLGKEDVITADVLEEKRTAALAYAAKNAITLDRQAVASLTWEQINGLAEASRQSIAAFTNSARALGLVAPTAIDGEQGGGEPARAETGSKPAGAGGAGPQTGTQAPRTGRRVDFDKE